MTLVQKSSAATNRKRSDPIRTWAVSKIDREGLEKKGTLAVENGALFFVAEGDRTPVHQFPMSCITITPSRTPGHVILELDDPATSDLHFDAGSKDVADAIVAVIERSSEDLSSLAPSRSSPLTPTLPENIPLPTETSSEMLELDQDAEATVSTATSMLLPSSAVINEDSASARRALITGVVRYYFAGEGDKLTVDVGETVTILDRESREAWWMCRNAAGLEGFIPASYLWVMPSSSSVDRPQSDLTFPDQNKVRLWRDRTGQFRVKAEYLGVKAGKLRLHKSNGVIIEVPLDKMSPEDLATIPRDMDTISMRSVETSVPNVPTNRS